MKCYPFVVYLSLRTLSLYWHVVKLWLTDESEVVRDFIEKRPDPNDWEKSQGDSQEQEGMDQDFTTTTTTTNWPDESQADADGYDSSEYEDDNNPDGNDDYKSNYGYNYDDVTSGYKDKYDALNIKEDLPDEHDEVERERNNFGTRRAAVPDLPGDEYGGGYEREDDGVMKSLRDLIRGNHWNEHTKWNSLCNLLTIFCFVRLVLKERVID